MAHAIEQHGDKAAFVSAREDAWHRLGTVVPEDALTAEQVLSEAYLGGWNVRTVPAFAHDENGEQYQIPGQFGVVRTNPFTHKTEPFPAVVGSRYVPIQNESLTDFLNTLVDESGAVFDTAGSLHNGTEVFVTMKMPKTLRIGGVDDLNLNIAALNSHNGKSAKRIIVTPVRIVCANTQAMALGHAKAKFAIRHTRNAGSQIQAVREALGLTFAYVDEFEQQAERMIQTSLTEAKFAEIVGNLYPKVDKDAPERQRNAAALRDKTLTQLFVEAPTNAGIANTVWGGLQAVWEYEDHFAPVKAHKSDPEVARAKRVFTPAVESHKVKAGKAFAALV